jgi:isopentenyl-diphosphate delta-isomerase
MKIQIVNGQDEIIGVKERTEVDYSKDIYRVSALWLTNSSGQTLLARRSLAKDKDPGRWGPAVAGTIDEGETYDDNIYKEAIEEIGLEGIQFTKTIKMRTTQPRNYFCQWYTATIDRAASSFTMQAEEVDALEWVDVEQLKRELITNPEKYTPTMPQVINELGI